MLINGRRVGGGTSTSTAVDFNTLPTANIERIEIITGGASAVYGSDAVAGVINIITNRRFEGLELSVGYGQASAGDNENPTGHVMWGRRFGEQGRVLATLQLDKQGQVSCKDRYICSEDFFWGTASNPLRGPAAYSGVGLVPRVFIGGNSFTGRNGSFTDAQGRLIPFDVTVDGYNRNANRDIAIPMAGPRATRSSRGTRSRPTRPAACSATCRPRSPSTIRSCLPPSARQSTRSTPPRRRPTASAS